MFCRPLVASLVAATTLAVAPLAASQEVERVLRLYDISLLVAEVEDLPGPDIGPDSEDDTHDGGGMTFGDDGEETGRLYPEEVMELIRGRVSPDSWRHADNRLSALDGVLHVVQTPEVHAQVASLLQSLRSELGRQVEVRVEAFRAEGARVRAVLAGTPGQSGIDATTTLREALQRAGIGTPLQVASVTLRDRQRGHCAVLRRRTFVADYEVEVAEKVTAPEPVIRVQQLGMVGDITAHPARDGRHVTLECRLAWAELTGDGRRAETSAGVIELPERHVTQVRGTASLAYGQSWLASGAGPGNTGTCFVLTPVRRASSQGAAPKQPDATSRRVTRAYNLGELLFTATDFPAPSLMTSLGANRGAAGGIPGLGGDEGYEPITSDQIADLIRANVDPDSWDHKAVRLSVSPTALLVTHTPAMHTQIEAYLKQVMQRRPPGLRLEAALCAADETLLAALNVRTGVALDGTKVNAWLAGAGRNILGYATWSARNQQLSHAALVQSVRVVGDYDVEVAQEARIADPVVVVGRAGFTAQLRPVLSGDARSVSLDLRAQWATVAQPIRTLTTVEGDISLLDVTHRGAETTLVLPMGGWGGVPVGSTADGQSLVLLVAARAVR